MENGELKRASAYWLYACKAMMRAEGLSLMASGDMIRAEIARETANKEIQKARYVMAEAQEQLNNALRDAGISDAGYDFEYATKNATRDGIIKSCGGA